MNRPFPWKCRECREKAVKPFVTNYTAELEHDGRLYTVSVNELSILRCEACGSQLLPDEAFAKVMDQLRREAKLLMPSEIRAGRNNLKLSQKDFAYLLGVAPETVSRWENGGQIQQRVMNDFIKAFFNVPQLREFLRALRGRAEPAVGTPPSLATNTTPTDTWTAAFSPQPRQIMCLVNPARDLLPTGH